MPCANVTGKHKFSLFVVGTAKKTPSFQVSHATCMLSWAKNAWITRELFLEWFKTEIVPAVRQHMKSVNLPQRALLLLDNCPGHPSAELYTADGEISAIFLPPNTTALIQPMDQNVIQNIKLRYRKLLFTSILNDPVHNENLENPLKKVNLKDVVFSLANCWASKNLVPNIIDSEVEENVQTEEIQLAPLINQLQNSNPISNPEALQWAAEADDSLARVEILTDDEIIRTVTAEDGDDDDFDTPLNSVKFLILGLRRHSILHYSGLKSNILKHTKLCFSDV
ncbi:hypothetical protein J437_LFUL019061 [Ladona fulva]|uniref:DDE-1 domain-containing protein n=1 Tax=Ladona fulva TaxID=123851 RepID=A0A8K0KRV0_LADFU|nr:hypothetical protein J437_LFUL019061 [Ladona fulva]